MIPEWMVKYIGIPYIEGGRDSKGADCYGLLRLIYQEQFGIEIPEYSHVAWVKDCDEKQLESDIEDRKQEWQLIDSGSEKIGDCILLKIAGVPIHLGMVVASGVMVHCARGHDSAIERYDSNKWQKRIEGFFRHEQRGGDICKGQAF